MATQEVLITPAGGKIEFKSATGGTLYSTIKDIDGVLYLIPATSSTVVFGDGTPANVELGAAGTPVSLTYLGGGILSSGGNTLNIGASGDTINLNVSGATYQFPSSLSLNIVGNAATATALQTPRTIALSGKVTAAGVAFDGTANITINSTSAAILSSEITDATNAATADKVIKRDSNADAAVRELMVTGAAGRKGVYASTSNYSYYSPESHSSNSWLRNSTNTWTFQGYSAGNASDDWTQTAAIYLAPVGTAGADDKLIEIGQRTSNTTAGDYKGVRIVHYTGSAIADGYLKAGTVDVSGSLVVSGDLTVNGTTTTINTATLSVDDKNIELGAVATPTDTTADGGGITLKGATDKTITWDNANDNWTSNQSWNISSGLDYKINNVSVLNATTLGSTVVTSSLTTVGTIGTGVWQGTSIKIGYGGTGLTSYSAGDMIYWASGVSMTALAIGSAGKILRSTGTAPAWSTPTFPNTATSGKHLYGDGTNWVESTPTFPNTATSGKFLYANGTNWVESTSTIPTSAGSTAGKYLVSDGTNYVLSSYTLTLGANTTINTSTANYAAYYSGTNAISGEQYLAVSRGGTGAGTFTANAILTGNTTSAIQAPGPTLSSTVMAFTGAGTINSATTNALTLDSGTTGAVNLGTNANAKTITIGNTTGATSVVVNSGTGGVTFNQVAAGIFKIQASAAPTTDMVQITNSGQVNVTADINALQVDYFAALTSTSEASAAKINITNTSTTNTTKTNALRVYATGSGTSGVVTNGLKLDIAAADTGTSNAIYVSTNWDNILNYNGTVIINGTGTVVAGQLTGTIPSAVLGNSTLYVGTTAIALNRASASQSLTGITSIDGYAAGLGLSGSTLGAIPYQATATTTSYLAATTTASKMLLSGASAAPTWSTSTIPTSAGATAGKYLVSDGTNYVLSTYTLTLGANTTINTSTANYAAYYSGTNTISGEQYLSVSRGGSGAGTFTANAILTGNTTSAFQAPGPTLSSSTMTFGGAGTINSTTTNALTLDSTSTGAINIGNNANAKTITIGNATGATSVVVNSGTSGVTFNQVAAGIFKIQASAAPTTDMVQITNSGQVNVTADINALQVDYFAALTSTAEASATKISITNTSTTNTTKTNALRVYATGSGTAGVVTNGLKLDIAAADTGTSNAIYASANWDNILNYNGTALINGTGEMYTTKMSVSLWKIQQDGTTNSLKFIYN